MNVHGTTFTNRQFVTLLYRVATALPQALKILKANYGFDMRSLLQHTEGEGERLSMAQALAFNALLNGHAATIPMYSLARTPTQSSKYRTIAWVERLFGERCLSLEALNAAFGFTPDFESVPLIPFSERELEEANGKGRILRLSWDTLPDGTPLTGANMEVILGGKQRDGSPLVDYHFNRLDQTFTEEAPQRKWVLTQNNIGYTGKDFFEQTDGLVKECPDMPRYRRAIEDYRKRGSHLKELIDEGNWMEAAAILADLDVVLFTRDSFAERFQHMAVFNRMTGKRIHEHDGYWTRSRSSGGDLVRVGAFDSGGARVDGRGPGRRGDDLGVAFSRSV